MLRLLSRLSITEKLLFSSAGLLIPLISFLNVYLQNAREAEQMTRTEMLAIQPLQDLSAVFEDIEHFEYLTSFQGEDGSRDIEVDQARIRVNQVLNRLSEGVAGNASKQVDKLRRNWALLSAPDHQATILERAEKRHEVSIEIVRIAREIADEQELLIDSDPDSYYVSVLASSAIPLSLAIVSDSALVTKGMESDTTSIPLMVHLAANSGSLRNGLISEVKHAAEIALKSDQAFRGISESLQRNLPKPTDVYVSEGRGCAQGIWEKLHTQSQIVTGSLSTECAAASRAGLALWRVSIHELKILQQSRMTNLQQGYVSRLLFSSFGFAFALGLMLLVLRDTKRTLQTGVDLAAHVANGRIRPASELMAIGRIDRLLTRLPPESLVRDESFRLLIVMNKMIARLEEVRQRLDHTNPAVSGAALQLRGAVRELEETVQGQVVSMAQASATAKRISSTTLDTERAVAAVTRIATTSAEAATEGQHYLDTIREALGTLIAIGQGVLEALGSIRDRAGEVDGVVTTITRIANRTNLISLNAAIEAERSGNNSSFSIVADEIQGLAEQTALAGRQIEELIHQAKGAVEKGTETIRRYAAQAQMTTESIEEVSGGLKRVMEGTQLFGPEFETVNQGMKAQSEASNDITDSIFHLDAAAARTSGAMIQCDLVLAHLEVALTELGLGISSLGAGE